MPAVQPGDVLRIDKKYLPHIGHDKYAICVCLTHGRFFFVNSKAWRFADPKTQVQVLGKIELAFLEHTSFVDTSKMHVLPSNAINHASRNGVLGSLPQSIRDRIKAAVRECKTLTAAQRALVEESL